MMIPVIDSNPFTGENIISNSAVKELSANNCTMPDIKRVIYNIKTKAWVRNPDGTKAVDASGKPFKADLKDPILATTVEFIDGTKVTVKNSLNDKVGTEVKKFSDGTEALIATESSKEIGLVYAIVKRLVGEPDSLGTVNGNGFGRILREIVSSAYDEVVAANEARIQKTASKKAHEELQKNAKPKVKNPSLLETAIDLSKNTKELAETIAVLKSDLEVLKAKMA